VRRPEGVHAIGQPCAALERYVHKLRDTGVDIETVHEPMQGHSQATNARLCDAQPQSFGRSSRCCVRHLIAALTRKGSRGMGSICPSLHPAQCEAFRSLSGLPESVGELRAGKGSNTGAFSLSSRMRRILLHMTSHRPQRRFAELKDKGHPTNAGRANGTDGLLPNTCSPDNPLKATSLTLRLAKLEA